MKIIFALVLLLNSCSNQYYNNNIEINYKNYTTIKNFKWKYRLLILVNVNDLSIINNIEKYTKQFIERDVIIITIESKSSYIDKIKMKKQFDNSLFKKIDPKSENTLFLIGKDGNIKEIYSSSINFDLIIQKIDSMPMRKREMDKQGL